MSEGQEFLKECKEVRNEFVAIAGQYTVDEHLKLRTEIDTLLIMYDQLCERVRLSDSLATLNEALAFISQANDEYRTYYSRIDGRVKETSKLVNDLANVIKNYR